jgi:hypothetical protein
MVILLRFGSACFAPDAFGMLEVDVDPACETIAEFVSCCVQTHVRNLKHGCDVDKVE